MIREHGGGRAGSPILSWCGHALAGRAAARHVGFCLLLSVPCFAGAEELADPTRPPPGIAAPAATADSTVERQPAGLQSVIISSTRRAAIIGGETVELGGKYGDAKLIEVNEGNVVLRGAQGRLVMTLFPDVKMRVAGRQEKKTGPAVHKEKR